MSIAVIKCHVHRTYVLAIRVALCYKHFVTAEEDPRIKSCILLKWLLCTRQTFLLAQATFYSHEQWLLLTSSILPSICDHRVCVWQCIHCQDYWFVMPWSVTVEKTGRPTDASCVCFTHSMWYTCPQPNTMDGLRLTAEQQAIQVTICNWSSTWITMTNTASALGTEACNK